jgi:hypothetical protein
MDGEFKARLRHISMISGSTEFNCTLNSFFASKFFYFIQILWFDFVLKDLRQANRDTMCYTEPERKFF